MLTYFLRRILFLFVLLHAHTKVGAIILDLVLLGFVIAFIWAFA